MIKRAAYFLLCAVEGVWPLAALFTLPAAESLTNLLGYSPLRIGLILAVLVAIALFAYLAWREYWAKEPRDSLIERMLAHRYALLLGGLVFLLVLAAAAVFTLSPLGSGRLNSYYLRFQPLFHWGVLIVVQFFALATLLRGAAYWVDAWRDLCRERGVRRMRRALNSPVMGVVLLAAAFLIGLSKVYYGRFVDEADNLTTGWLLSQGYTLYRDVFSHHFPFPYYWVALVVKLFGNSFVAVRVSLLVLGTGLFAASMRFSRFYLSIGLTALAWSLTNQFHRGQEAIYASFEAILMAVAFMVVLRLVVRRSPAGKWALAYCGLLLGLAVLTDPLMVYPALVALAAIFASGLRRRSGRWGEGLRRALWAGGAALAVAGVFALSLLASGTAKDFYREAIWFNAAVYAKYEDADPDRTGVILQNLATGLDVFDERWRRYTSPFVPLNTYRSVRLEDENLYATWVFSGLLARLSILACSLGLILNRKYLAAVFLYLFAASLMVRANDGLYAMGFTLLSLFAAFYMLASLRRPVWIQALRRRGRRRSWLAAQAAWLILVAVIALMQAWTAFRGGYYLLDNWNTIQSKRHVAMFNQFGDDIRELTCNLPGVELAVYPINPIVYFVAGIPPASRYTFMYPWVAEVGQQELISELRAHPSAVVWIKTSRKSGSPEGVAAYMAETIDFLDREYVVMGEDFWMSPELAERCPVTPGKIPFTQDADLQ